MSECKCDGDEKRESLIARRDIYIWSSLESIPET